MTSTSCSGDKSALQYRRFLKYGIIGICIVYLVAAITQTVHAFGIFEVKKIPTVLEELGMKYEQYEVSKTSLLVLSIAFVITVLLQYGTILLVIFKNAIPTLWRHVNVKFLPDKSPSVKAAAFGLVWQTFAIFLSFFGVQMVGNYSDVWYINFAIQMAGGAIYGFLFHTIFTNFRPFKAYLILCMLGFFLTIAQTSVQVWELKLASIPFDFERSEYASTKEMFQNHGMSFDRARRVKLFNAFYMSDIFGNDVVCVGEPLMDKASPEEVTAVLAHELGHRQHHDIHKLFAVEFANIMIWNAVTAFFISGNPLLHAAIGFETEPIIAAFPISDVLSMIGNQATRPLVLWLSRTMEYAADSHATKLGYGTPLSKFLLVVNPMKMFSLTRFFEYSFMTHPSGLNRVQAIQKIQETL